MNNNYLSIGEMAKMNHITVTTLRLYDELDLLKPVYVNPETNYRYYDIKQNARLDLIQYMKELQMNLKEIKELLDKEDINLIEAILIKKKQQLSIQERFIVQKGIVNHPQVGQLLQNILTVEEFMS